MRLQQLIMASFALAWVACGPTAPQPTSSGSAEKSSDGADGETEETGGNADSGGVDGENAADIKFTITNLKGKPVDDAHEFVSALAPVSFVIRDGQRSLSDDEKQGSLDLVSKNVVYLDEISLSDLSADEREIVDIYCGSIYVSMSEDHSSIADAEDSGELGDREFFIGWRAHYSQATRDGLAALLLNHESAVFCGLEVTASTDLGDGPVISFVFDPAPQLETVSDSAYSGTDDVAAAVNAAVMLMRNDGGGSPPKNLGRHALTKDNVAAIDSGVRGIRAINATDFTVEVNVDAASDCEMHLTDQYRPGTPTQRYVAKAIITNVPNYQALSFELTDSLGRGPVDGCDDLDMTVATDGSGIDFDTDCSTIATIYADNAISCEYMATLSPVGDEVADVTARVIVEFDVEEKIFSDPVAASEYFPTDPDNPLRAGTVDLLNFTPTMETELARAYDFWMVLSRSSYDVFSADINNTYPADILRITFDGDVSQAPCDVAGAYASFGDDEYFWCPGGAMTPDFLTPQASPNAHLYRAMTALHETMHTRNRDHDFNVPGYVSCTQAGGTSYSAILAVEMFRCEEPYCYGFRNVARNQLLSEVNYSLSGDGRRFAGACADWAAELGVDYAAP